MQELEVAGGRLGSCYTIDIKRNSFQLKGKLYAACIGSVMYGSETWVIRTEDERRCERNKEDGEVDV